MGRGGYGHADQEYMRAKIKEALLSAPSSLGAESASSTSIVATRPRYIKWIDGRTDKKGLIPNPKTRLVVNTIHDLVEKEKAGEFIPVGSHDILTEALGNSEHGGRVRGIGGKANLTSFFKRKKRRQNEIMVPLKQLQEYAKLVRDQTIAELEVKWEQRTYEILKSCGITPPCDVELKTRDFTPPIPNSSSVHSFDPDPFVNTSKDELPCELTVPGNRVVAKGVLCKHLMGELVHGTPLLKDHFKVKILHVLAGEEDTPLPMPFFGHDLLGDVEGSWAQWPKKQVLLSQEVNHPQRKKRMQADKSSADSRLKFQPLSQEEQDLDSSHFKIHPSIVGTLPPSCKKLYGMLQSQKKDFCFNVDLGEYLFPSFGNQKSKAYVTSDDIEQFFNMGWLHTSIVHIWIRFLDSNSKHYQIEDEIGFLCPSKLAMIKSRPSYLASYLNHSISQLRMKKFLFAPLHQSHHWMLVVIIMERAEALLFNSLGVGLMGPGFEDLEIKGHLSLAYRTLNFNKGSRSSLSWTEVKCPQQSRKDECGYYVMRFMYDILLGLLENRTIQEVFIYTT
ncbi:unnamed protein product [Cuscuta epithymum]|uniref:Ubiquitin-like protease family profile domain-containing protein n=1 Tax=Cuscuta epithymum TaxID=186058 RepID=A0AAV0DQP9_9ASTE|nr:unnamed protein product [Cuscuta epithymum]